nr:HNH endonuclease signature motif containing protein [Candidatus Microthrix sp.]
MISPRRRQPPLTGDPPVHHRRRAHPTPLNWLVRRPAANGPHPPLRQPPSTPGPHGPRRRLPLPGCGRPAHWCDAHHADHWDTNGTTDIENLALLCRHHHRVTHRPGWAMTRDQDTGDPNEIRFRWRTPPVASRIPTTPPTQQTSRSVGQ